MLAVPPVSTHHVVEIAEDGVVTGVREVRELMQWENGGYFVLRPGIFDVLREGEDMVPHAFARLIPQGRLLAQRYDRLLAGRRHLQGPGRAGGHVPARPVPVDAVGRQPARRHAAARPAGAGPRPTPC